MKALIVGGTKGFGINVADIFRQRGYEVVTTGRSGGDVVADVGDASEWDHALIELTNRYGAFDVVVCVVGFARAIEPSDCTNQDKKEHFQKNTGYILQLLNTLQLSVNATIVTVGSQWSFNTGARELDSYIAAKWELRELTKRFADAHPELSVVHVAVPAMDTPQRALVWKKYGEMNSQTKIADPMMIAEVLVRVVVMGRLHGESIQIDSEGDAREVIM